MRDGKHNDNWVDLYKAALLEEDQEKQLKRTDVAADALRNRIWVLVQELHADHIGLGRSVWADQAGLAKVFRAAVGAATGPLFGLGAVSAVLPGSIGWSTATTWYAFQPLFAPATPFLPKFPSLGLQLRDVSLHAVVGWKPDRGLHA